MKRGASDILQLLHEFHGSQMAMLAGRGTKRAKTDPDTSGDDEVPGPSKKVPAEPVNPLMLDVVLDVLFRYCSVEDLKTARLVNHKWNFSASLHMQKRAVNRFTIPPEFLCTEWSHDHDRKSKQDQFFHYARCYMTRKLPMADSESFLFKNFSFTNFPYFNAYYHDKLLKFIVRNFASNVRSLRFWDDPTIRISDAFLEMNNLRRLERHFRYPDWESVFTGLVNLQSLELVGMPRSEVEKCLTALESLLEKGARFQIRRLVISPRDQPEFHLNQFAYLSYVDLLKNVISLLPVQELHLCSKCSAEEVRGIVGSRKNDLKRLVLHRYVPIESTLNNFQNQDGSFFRDMSFPNLVSVEIPTVYLEDIGQIISACPILKHLKMTFQPTEICNLVTNSQGVQVIETTRIVKVGFFKDQILRPEPPTYGNNCKLESLHWALEDSLVRNAPGSNHYRHWNQLNFIVTSFLTATFPNIKTYTGIILSEREVRAVFKHLPGLEEFRVTRSSVHALHDGDIVGTNKFQVPAEPVPPGAAAPVSSPAPSAAADEAGGPASPNADNAAPIAGTSTSAAGPAAAAPAAVNGESPTASMDKLVDAAKPTPCGIRVMKNLRRLYLENDNSHLSYESFDYGFLKLPHLQVLHIHRAKQLSKDDTAIVALLDSSSLSEVQIHEN